LDQTVEEIRGRELLGIAHDDDLSGTSDRPQRIFRSHLARFVNEKQVELQTPRR
jgi:hypothetical protein